MSEQSGTPIPVACEVPFIEQLRSVPKKLRASYEIQWAEDGTPTGHSLVPVGFMMHRAADELAAAKAENAELRAELAAAKKDAERYRWLRKQYWNDASICVVRNPKVTVKLGTDCPSGDRLDEAIDATIATAVEERKGTERRVRDVGAPFHPRLQSKFDNDRRQHPRTRADRKEKA